MLIGDLSKLRAAFLAAGWTEADPLGLTSSWRMVVAFVLNRPYPSAPFSTLFLFGRGQDVGFQKAIDMSPRKRHHVRFWSLSLEQTEETSGKPEFWLNTDRPANEELALWVGAATKDTGMSFTRFTFQVTHKTDADTNAERDLIVSELKAAGAIDALAFHQAGERLHAGRDQSLRHRWRRRRGESRVTLERANLCIPLRSEQEGLVVRRMTEADLELALDWAAAEGWNPGLHDAHCFYAADPQGFFLGEIDGAPVGCVSAVRYGLGFGFLGLYIVNPERRGQGFGLALWRAALDRLGDRVVGLDGVVAQQENYRKSGFRLAFRNIRQRGEGGGEAPAGLADLEHSSSHEIARYDEALFRRPAKRFSSHGSASRKQSRSARRTGQA